MKLAKKLVEQSFADKAFFCNSGTEANEAAIKFARKWARVKGAAQQSCRVAVRPQRFVNGPMMILCYSQQGGCFDKCSGQLLKICDCNTPAMSLSA